MRSVTMTPSPPTVPGRPGRRRTPAGWPAALALILGGAAAPALGQSAGSGLIDLTIRTDSGACGQVSGDTAGTQKLIDLGCGGLNLGGGGSAAPPGGPVPEGSVNRFGLRSCAGDVCEVFGVPDATQPVDCTDTGCRFGLPLPVFGFPPLCLVNTFASPASGTIDLATGTTNDLNVSLSSAFFGSGTYYVDRGAGFVAEPCPVCVDSVDVNTGLHPLTGSPNNPQTGVCGGGPRAGQPCTTRNSSGLTHDCLPGGNALVGPDTLDRPCAVGEGCIDQFQQTASNLGAIASASRPCAPAASQLRRSP